MFIDPLTAASLISFGIKASLELSDGLRSLIEDWAKKDDPTPEETTALHMMIRDELAEAVKDDVPGSFDEIGEEPPTKT